MTNKTSAHTHAICMALPHENNDHIREYFTARHYGHKKACNHDEETLQVVKSM